MHELQGIKLHNFDGHKLKVDQLRYNLKRADVATTFARNYLVDQFTM